MATFTVTAKQSRLPASVWRTAPHTTESPQKTFCRGPAIYIRTNGEQFCLPPSPPTKKLKTAENLKCTSTSSKQNSGKSLNEQLCATFLEMGIDLNGTTKIGGGRYSKVFTAQQLNKDGTKKKIAIKVINEDRHSLEYVKKFLPREIVCWRKLSHPFIVKLLGHYSSNNHTFLSMEYAEHGDLLGWVQANGALPEGTARLWVQQIIEGVGYMHTMGVAHRDLKLENIMIFHRKVVKIGDFGFAKEVGYKYSNTHCGSKSYSAPEILAGKQYNPYKSDTWAVGIVIFIMVTNQMPFREDQPNSVIIDIQKKGQFKYPSNINISYECRRVIAKMLQYYPQERPKKVTEVLSYPWFR